MKYFLLIFCLNSIILAGPYIKKFWKPLQFEQEKKIFDRNKLIPIEQGEYNFSADLPETPNTIETIVTAGNINPGNESFINKELSADNVIQYLKDTQVPRNQKTTKVQTVEPTNVYINSIRRIKEM